MMALQGIVQIGDSDTRETVTAYVDDASEGDPAVILARKLLEKPNRYSRMRIR